MSVQNTTNLYYMKTASVTNTGIQFDCDADFAEAIKVGFFRIKTPDDVDLKVGREFARKFTKDTRYIEVGEIDPANGFLQSDFNQTKRFTLERDRWDAPHFKDGKPNYPKEIQELGHKLNAIGVKVLNSILEWFQIPKDQWFKTTGGSSELEGSHFLLFNCYDPEDGGNKADGVAPHKDWSEITVLDAVEPGLEAKIDGVWRAIHVEDGYLTINFGYPLEKLLPGGEGIEKVNASEHRVVTQHKTMRTSTVAFIDPRVGPFRPNVAKADTDEGYVYDWNPATKQLVNGVPTLGFFKELSDKLYGSNQSGKTEKVE